MSVSVEKHKNLVGGEWVDASDGGTEEVLNPATGETIAEVPKGTEADVDRAVEAAKKAWAEWRGVTPAERAELLLKLADVIDEHTDELAEIESRNVGKPLGAARDEMPVCSDNLRFFAGAARLLEGRSAGEYMAGYTSMIRREPIGIVGQVAPWNYPLMMAVWKFAPALAAGNVSVLKPSEQTPLSTLRFAELAADVIPAGVLNVITGDGEPVGAGIVRHPDVRMVSLTGDVATGREVAKAASETLKRVHLELGGKAPVVVFDDADPAQVAEAIKIAGYWNSGQDCTAASRVMAGPKIYDKLLEELVPAVESMNVGDPADGDEIEMGPVISKAQQDRILGFLDRASGAQVLTGGGTNGDRGFFVNPTVVAGVDQTDEIVQREVFGPVVTVQRFDDDDQAIAWANDVNVRARRLRLHPRRRPGPQRRAEARVRHRLDQRPHPARLGDAARRLQAVGLRQGPLRLLARGLHPDQARDGQARLTRLAETTVPTAAGARRGGARPQGGRDRVPRRDRDRPGVDRAGLLAGGGDRDDGGDGRRAGAGRAARVLHPDVPDRDRLLLHEQGGSGRGDDVLLGDARARAVAGVDRRLGGLHHRDPRRRLAGRRRCPVLVSPGRRRRRGRLEGGGHRARRHLHRRPDRDLRDRHRALRSCAERDDPRAGRRPPPVRRRRAGEGLGRRRARGLDRPVALVVLALRDRRPRHARLVAADRRLHLLGLGVGRQPHRGDRGLPVRVRDWRPC